MNQTCPPPQAYKAVGESTEIPLAYYANNVAATISLLQIMSDYDCTRIVYSSSATVYGTPPIIPIPEGTRLEAHSPYGTTKIMAETIIDDLCHGSFGLHVEIEVYICYLLFCSRAS
jgi:UDP-glucose 4-epimerase